MKKIITMLIFAASGICLFGQPVLTSAFNPLPGDEWKFHPVNTQIQPGASGANVTWDFSTIQVIYNPVVGRHLAPATTPFAADFPDATVAFESKQEVGTFIYYRGSSNKLEKLGEASIMVTLQYPDPPDIYTYPFTFGSTTTSSYGDTSKVGQLDLERTATWTATCDAYGTLMLPTGTHQNVLRVKTESVVIDNYSGGVGEQRIDAEVYLWIDPNTRIPLMRMIKKIHYSGGAVLDTISSILIADAISGIMHPDPGVTLVNLYPSPANETTTLSFQLQQPAVITIDVYSADGKKVLSGTSAPHDPGNHRQEIALHALTPGVYLLKLSTGKGSAMIRFVKF